MSDLESDKALLTTVSQRTSELNTDLTIHERLRTELIVSLSRQGVPIKELVDLSSLSRNTVHRYLVTAETSATENVVRFDDLEGTLVISEHEDDHLSTEMEPDAIQDGALRLSVTEAAGLRCAISPHKEAPIKRIIVKSHGQEGRQAIVLADWNVGALTFSDPVVDDNDSTMSVFVMPDDRDDADANGVVGHRIFMQDARKLGRIVLTPDASIEPMMSPFMQPLDYYDLLVIHTVTKGSKSRKNQGILSLARTFNEQFVSPDAGDRLNLLLHSGLLRLIDGTSDSWTCSTTPELDYLISGPHADSAAIAEQLLDFAHFLSRNHTIPNDPDIGFDPAYLYTACVYAGGKEPDLSQSPMHRLTHKWVELGLKCLSSHADPILGIEESDLRAARLALWEAQKNSATSQSGALDALVVLALFDLEGRSPKEVGETGANIFRDAAIMAEGKRVPWCTISDPVLERLRDILSNTGAGAAEAAKIFKEALRDVRNSIPDDSHDPIGAFPLDLFDLCNNAVPLILGNEVFPDDELLSQNASIMAHLAQDFLRPPRKGSQKERMIAGIEEAMETSIAQDDPELLDGLRKRLAEVTA